MTFLWMFVFGSAAFAAFAYWLFRREITGPTAEPELPGGLLITTLDGSSLRALTGGPKRQGDAGGAFGGGGGGGGDGGSGGCGGDGGGSC